MKWEIEKLTLSEIIRLKVINRSLGQKLAHLKLLERDFRLKRSKQNSLFDWTYSPPDAQKLKHATEEMLNANERFLEYKSRINYPEIKVLQKNNGKKISTLREALSIINGGC